MKLTAIIKKGEKQFVGLCPEVDVASQGKTIEETITNLREAVELHIEVVGIPEGISDEETMITSFEVVNEKEASKAIR